MNTEFWTESEVDDFVERLTTHLDADAARSGTAAEPGESDPDGAEALTEELRTAATWAGPPANLRETILARARAERGSTAAADAPAPTPGTPQAAPDAQVAQPVAPGWRMRRLAGWPVRWRRLVWTVPVAALAAALFTIVGIAADRALQPDQPPTQVFAITGGQLAPQARGQVRVSDMPSGFSIELDVQRVPAAAPGSYYAAWLRGPEGIVPLGSFHLRGTGAPVRLWSGVPPDRYPDLVVTLQAEGAALVPSQQVVMTASLAD